MSTFLQLYGELLDRELGSADRSVLFTTARRQAAVNEGQREFNRLTECFVRSVSLALTNAVAEYDLEAAITAADYLWLAKQGVELKTVIGTTTTYYAGDDFPRKDIETLNREDPGWRQASAGTPSCYYIRDDGGKVYVGLYPKPAIDAGETWTLEVPYVAQPADMSTDGGEPYTASADVKISLRPWHQALVHYAAEQMEKLRKDTSAQDRQRTKFSALVADYLQRQRPKGGQRVQMSRDYRSVARSRGMMPAWAKDIRR